MSARGEIQLTEWLCQLVPQVLLLSHLFFPSFLLSAAIGEEPWSRHIEAGRKAFQEARYLDSLDQYRAAYNSARSGNMSPELRGQILISMGSCLLRLSNYKGALGHFLQARPYVLRGGNREHLGTLDSNIATVYLYQGDLENAARMYKQALGRLKGTPESDVRSAILGNLGVIELREGRYRRALDYEQAALRAATKGVWLGAVYDLIGWAHLRLREFELARESFTRSLELRRNSAEAARSLMFLGRTEWERGRPTNAIDKLNQAIASARRDNPDTVWESYYLRGQCYRDLKRVSEAAGDFRQAINILESVRVNLVPTDALRVGFEVNHHEVYQSLADMLCETEPGPAAAAFHAVEMGRVQSLRGSALDLSQSQRTLDPETLVLYFQLSARNAYLWAITDTDTRFYKVLPPGEPLRHFVDAIHGPAGRRRTLGLQLYQALVGQVDPTLLRRPHWIISSDGDLASLPFCALIAPSGRYLIEDHSISYIPSMSVLQLLKAREPREYQNDFLGIADPVVNLADPRAKGAIQCADKQDCFSLPRVVSSAAEVQTCARLFRPARSSLLTGLNAAATELRRLPADSYRYWHFTSHVVIDPEHPDNSFIALTIPDRLTVLDILKLPLRADMVVINGCDSGTGKVLPGAGVLGLARAFLVAGAQSVCATRWKIPDEGGALVRGLYAHLLEPAPNRAVALQRAQIEMIRAGDWRSEPRYWAAYFLVGTTH